MAENIATLGLRLDANGFIVGTRQVESSLNSLSTASGKVEGKVRAFSMNSAFALSSLASSGARDITSVLRSLSSLGFAFGVQVGVITLAISAIADAWSESGRKAKEEQEKQLADLQAFQQKFTLAATRMRISTLEARDAALAQRLTTEFGGADGRGRRTIAGGGVGDMIKEREEIARRIGPLRIQETQQVKALLVEEQKVTEERRKQSGEALKSIQAEAVKRYVAQLVDADDAAKNLAQAGKELTDSLAQSDASQLAAGMDAINATLNRNLIVIGKELEVMKEQEESAKRRKQILLGIGLGAVTGALAASGPVGGVIGSAVSGVVGAAAGGPWAMAAAGTVALVGGLFGLSKAAKAAREETKRLQEALTQQVNDWVRGAETAVEQIKREEIALLKDIQAMAAAKKMTYAQELEMTERVIIAAHKRINALLAEEAQLKQFADEELEIRAQRALGNDEYAEALARQLEKERELTEARNKGATETELSRIAEVQRAEDIKKAMDKIQVTIDGLTSTITGLQDFRNSLLLSDDAGLSDPQKLKEARRQYTEILKLTQGDDIAKAQDAAGRLPAAAQALLNLSRSVNASGPGFQSDLAQILADNAATIQRFEDLRTIEELMLEELRKIQTNTESLQPLHPDNYPLPPIERYPVGAEAPVVAALQGGFEALSAKIDLLTARVDAGTTATNRIPGDLAAVLQ
jgi:hypothetical protein